MEKHEYLACMDLHTELKKRIKGKIFVAIRDNTFDIFIKDNTGIKYKRTVENISKEIGVNNLANRIMNDYKGYIINRFFFTK